LSINKINMYDVDSHIAEIYDTSWETDGDDAEYLCERLRECGAQRIVEPFCGTGRILIPLAEDGYELVGMDQAKGMLDRARLKIAQLPAEVQQRIALIEADVTSGPWPTGFAAVILGCNCFYELATPEEQEGCIISAARALRPGGCVFIDHDTVIHGAGGQLPPYGTAGRHNDWPYKSLSGRTPGWWDDRRFVPPHPPYSRLAFGCFGSLLPKRHAAVGQERVSCLTA